MSFLIRTTEYLSINIYNVNTVTSLMTVTQKIDAFEATI